MTAANSTGDIQKLRETVEVMDCFSQSAFDRIELLAELTLRSMERPETYKRIEDIGAALIAIKNVAAEAMNEINSVAEDVGCNFVDELQRKRSSAIIDAARKARELETLMEVVP